MLIFTGTSNQTLISQVDEIFLHGMLIYVQRFCILTYFTYHSAAKTSLTSLTLLQVRSVRGAIRQ